MALAGMVVLVCLAGLLLILDLPSSTSRSGVSGTMMDSGSSAPAVSWESGRLRSSLDDAVTIRWDMEAGSTAEMPSTLRLYTSRDENFNQSEDCFIETVTTDNVVSGSLKIESRFQARSIECLDAGSWYVLVVDDASLHHVLPNRVEIESGEIDMVDLAVVVSVSIGIAGGVGGSVGSTVARLEYVEVSTVNAVEPIEVGMASR